VVVIDEDAGSNVSMSDSVSDEVGLVSLESTPEEDDEASMIKSLIFNTVVMHLI
jgi:hypothetical protein